MMKPEAVPLEEGYGGLSNTAATTAAAAGGGGGCGSSAACYRTRTIWHFLHQFCVPVLFGLVIFLSLQLQYLARQVRKEQEQLDALQQQVANQQAGQQTLTLQVEQNHSLTLYQMAGTFTLLASLLTMFHMSTHLRNYHEPAVQRKVISILWMSVVYSVTSFLSLIFPVADGYLAVIKDFYESWTVYNFLSFLIAVLGRAGDRQAVVQVLARHGSHLKPPSNWLRRFYHPPPETSHTARANAVLTECQISCLQFVLVRPLTSIASFVNYSLSEQRQQHQHATSDTADDNPWAYFWSPGFFIAMVTNASVFLAFRGLLRFYHAVHDDLSWMQPFNKFMSIKGIVFLTFWQGLLISIVVHLRHDGEDGFGGGGDGVSTLAAGGMNATTAAAAATAAASHHQMSPREEAAQIQNILICLEMLFFSIAHWCVFPAEEWQEGYRPPKEYAKPGIGLQDFVSDMSYIVSSSRERRRHKRQQRELEKQRQQGGGGGGLDDDNSISDAASMSSEFELTTRSQDDHLHRDHSDSPPPPPCVPLEPLEEQCRVESSASSSSLSRRSPRTMPKPSSSSLV